MNPSTKEMVDAFEKLLQDSSLWKQENFASVSATDIMEAYAADLLSITEKAVASERAKIREGVEKLPKAFPERESDEYDMGMTAALQAVLALIDKSL